MALTEEQRNPWRAIVAGGDYNLSSQDWEDLLTELDSLYAEAPIAQPASAPSEQKPVAYLFEDVVRAAFDKTFDPDDNGTHWHTFRDGYECGEQAARANLVAENERLKATPPDQRQDLHCVVSDIAAECRELHDQLTAARTALAAVEARESATRAILDQVMDDIRSEAFLFDGGNGISADTEDAADNLLNQPSDDSALREMIAGVYEDCAKACDDDAKSWTDYSCEMAARDCADIIRALAEKAHHGS